MKNEKETDEKGERKKNTGIKYEKLTQIVFDQIINQNSIQTIKVEHNVKLKGKSTWHQIDVYWEFKLGDIVYRTIIQAKDWKSQVPQSAMIIFKGVLDDLPSGTKGIFVTKTGYQKGAIDIAKEHGIALYEFRKPTEQDWKGRIKEINIVVEVTTPLMKDLEVVIDRDWLKDNGINLKGDLKKLISIEDTFENKNEGKEMNLKDLFKMYCDNNDEPKYVVYNFEDAYLYKADLNERIKINEIRGTFGYIRSTDNTICIGEDVVGFILKNVTDGTRQTLNKNAQFLGGKHQ